MCTILLAWRCIEGSDLVLAANRDEFLGRESLAPGVLVDRPRIAGGSDAATGGTWMAIGADARVALVTNRYCNSVNPSRRSRGELPLALLQAGDADAVERFVGGLDAAAYNPFNVLYVSRDAAVVGHGDGAGRVRMAQLEPGLHVLTLCDVDQADDVKVAFLAQHLRAAAQASHNPTALLAAMEDLLAEHGDAKRRDLESTCVHGDGYGTVSSSSVVVLHGRVTYRHAFGPPCTAAWKDLSGLLA